VIDRTIWAWLGLVLAIIIVGGAWMNMQAAGEGLGDVRAKVSAMTAGSAASGGTSEVAPPPPAPPAPPTAPAPPAADPTPPPAPPEATGGDDEPRSA
jgi:hypothetical protein